MLHPGNNSAVYEELEDKKLTAVQPPFTSAMMAGYVRGKGFNVEILDANVEHLSYAETADRVRDINPGIVGIIVDGHQPSASSQTMGAVGEVCRRIKGISNIPIVLSGVHPSSIPERTLREEEIDFVARGEEAQTLLGLVDGGLRSGRLVGVPGLCYLDNGVFMRNKSAKLAKSLDDAFHEYFSNPDYLNLVERKLGGKAVEHIKEMSAHRLKRRILGDSKD